MEAVKLMLSRILALISADPLEIDQRGAIFLTSILRDGISKDDLSIGYSTVEFHTRSQNVNNRFKGPGCIV